MRRCLGFACSGGLTASNVPPVRADTTRAHPQRVVRIAAAHHAAVLRATNMRHVSSGCNKHARSVARLPVRDVQLRNSVAARLGRALPISTTRGRDGTSQLFGVGGCSYGLARKPSPFSRSLYPNRTRPAHTLDRPPPRPPPPPLPPAADAINPCALLSTHGPTAPYRPILVQLWRGGGRGAHVVSSLQRSGRRVGGQCGADARRSGVVQPSVVWLAFLPGF